jgi:hypothetical protein
MNAFADACLVEQRGMSVLLPFLESRAYRADVVGFHFLDADTVLFLPLFRLQQWAFGVGDRAGRIFAFPERTQRRYAQRNDTWGRIVPVDVLAAEVGMKREALRQGELFRVVG